MTLAVRLKTARETLGKTQRDIASGCSVSVQMWQGYESGKSVPGGKVLEGLARLGINVNWLLTGEGEVKISKALGEKENSPRWDGNRNFLMHASMIDFYLESKYYENIPNIARAQIYSIFHNHVQKNHRWDHRIVADIISEVFEPSFTLHDLDIVSIIRNIVDKEFFGKEETAKNKIEKNSAYWKLFDDVCDRFCYGRVVAPLTIKGKVIQELNKKLDS